MQKTLKFFLFLFSSVLIGCAVQMEQKNSNNNINIKNSTNSNYNYFYYKNKFINDYNDFMTLKVQENCFVKISKNWLKFSLYVDNIVATWTGECKNGKPQGLGSLRWWKEGSLALDPSPILEK